MTTGDAARLDPEKIRRAAKACRNLQLQATGRVEWFNWVPQFLDRLAADADAAHDDATPGRHHRFCSAGGWPCPIGCQDWPESAAECFPNLSAETVEQLDAQPDATPGRPHEEKEN